MSNRPPRNRGLPWAIALLAAPIILLPMVPFVNDSLIPDDAGDAAIGYAGMIAIGYLFLSLASVAGAAVILAANFQRSRVARMLLVVLVVLAAAGLAAVMISV